MAILFFENKFFPKAKHGKAFADDVSYHQKKAVAFENNGVFFSVSLNSGGEPLIYKISPGQIITLKEWVLKSFGDANPIESDYIPGTFYKRIWRIGGPQNTTDEEKRTQAFVALKILLAKLEELFETVEPTATNAPAFGHKIREVILLACMEAESSWSAVLKENGYTGNGRFSTKDHVKLAKPMFLDAYELTLQQYPNFPSFNPFKGWDVTRPTASLPWYEVYNNTKHDREGNLKLATLENAIWSVGAVVVMFRAQFGARFGPIGGDTISPVINNVFRIHDVDLAKYEKEYYIPNLELPLYSKFPQWTALNYPFV